MDEQNNDIPITPEEPVIPQATSPILKTDQYSKLKVSPLVFGMGVLLVVLLLITGFLGFNNMQLRSEINSAKTSIAAMEAEQTKLTTETPSSTETPNPIAGWDTYTDAEYDFRLQYPPDWEVRDLLPANHDTPSHSDDLVFLGIAPESIKEDFFGSIIVKSGDVLEDEIENAKTFPAGTPMKLVSEETITFVGLEATQIETENTVAKVTGKVIIFKNNAHTYIINGGGSEDNSTINQILSTFEFTQ